MRPLVKPLLTVGAAVMVVTTACTDDASTADDTVPDTAQASPSETTEPTRESDGVLTIGILLPQTGEGSSIGNPGIAAATQAVNEINNAGGVLSGPIRLVIADEGTTLEDAQAGVDTLLSQNVDAIVGPGSSLVALDVLDQLMAAGVVTCSPTATSMTLDDFPNRELFFRTIPSDSLAAEGIAVQAGRTGVTAATVVYLDDGFARPIARAVRAALLENSIDPNPDVPLKPAGDDYAEVAQRLETSEPGTIIVIADSEHGWAMLSAMAEVFDDPPTIIVNDAMREPPAELVAALPETFRTAIQGVSPLGTPQNLDDEPTGPFATNSYDCVNLIGLASLVADSDQPAAIAAEIRRVANEGAGCASFKDCVEAIDAGRGNIDYEGPWHRVTISAKGDSVPAYLMLFRFADSGIAADAGTSRIGN